MASPARRSFPCGASGEQRACDPRMVLGLLNDDTARAIFEHARTPSSVHEFAEELEIPQSTVYRKVNELVDAGLLVQLEQGPLNPDPTVFVRSTDVVSVSYDDTVQIECVKNGIPLTCEL